jgi:hypothetical protein
MISQLFVKPKDSDHPEIIKRLHDISGSLNQLANTILAILVGSSVELSLGASAR